MIAKHIDRYAKERAKTQDDLPAIEKERSTIGEEYRHLIGSVGPLGQEFFKARREQLEARLAHLNKRRETAMTEIVATPKDAASIAENVKEQIANLVPLLVERSVSVRPLVGCFVSKCEVDLETKGIELELAIPGWGMTRNSRALETISVVQSEVHPTMYHTNVLDPLVFAKYRLIYRRTSEKHKGVRVWYTSEPQPIR